MSPLTQIFFDNIMFYYGDYEIYMMISFYFKVFGKKAPRDWKIITMRFAMSGQNRSKTGTECWIS